MHWSLVCSAVGLPAHTTMLTPAKTVGTATVKLSTVTRDEGFPASSGYPRQQVHSQMAGRKMSEYS